MSCCLVAKSCPILFVTPWTVACQAPLSMGFPRQEYWSGLPFPSPGIFPTQGSNLGLLHCRQMLYRLNHQGSLLPKENHFELSELGFIISSFLPNDFYFCLLIFWVLDFL